MKKGRVPFARRNITVPHISAEEFETKYRKKFRKGKTARDRERHAHANALGHKRKPIRCTSSHRQAGPDNRTEAFWLG